MTNINAYYKYAQENRKRNKKELQRTLLWFGLVLFTLLGAWVYLNYFNTPNKNNSQEIMNKSEVIMTENEILKSTLKDKTNIPTSVSSDVSKIMKETGVEKAEVVKKGVEAISKVEDSIKEASTSLSHSVQIDKNLNNKEIEDEAVKVVESITLNSNALTASTSLENKIINEAKIKIEQNTGVVKTQNNIDSTSVAEINASSDTATKEIIPSKVTSAKVTSAELPQELFHLYLVQQGETMYDIARKQYGDTNMYLAIVDANPDIENPDDIKEGQEILLPIVDESKSYSQILHFK